MNRIVLTSVLLITASTFVMATCDAAERRARRRFRVDKSKRQAVFEIDGKVVRKFNVGLGASPKGDKHYEGDLKTPEGRFYVAWKNPGSAYHRFFGLSYPMPRHARAALAAGKISKKTAAKIERAARNKKKTPQFTGLGGLVGVHGGGAGADWTLGCIAMSDEEVEWLYDRIRIGDEVVVTP